MPSSASATDRKESLVNTNRYKLVVVGDGACGKTCLLTVFKTGTFPKEYVPTIFETDTAWLRIPSHGHGHGHGHHHGDDDKHTEEIELTLWDTAGQESYNRLRPLSYSNSDVVVVCFSIDSPDSLANVEQLWVKEVHHFCRNVPLLLVGNKVDLRHDPATLQLLERQGRGQTPVTAAEARQVAQRIKAVNYVECSALNNDNVAEVFVLAARAAMAMRKNNRLVNSLKSKCQIL